MSIHMLTTEYSATSTGITWPYQYHEQYLEYRNVMLQCYKSLEKLSLVVRFGIKHAT